MANKGLRAKGKFAHKQTAVTVDIELVQFEEDGVIFVFSPALDLTGYGKDEEEAQKSFTIMLREFLEYAVIKHTLLKELKRLGWHIKGKEFKVITAPSLPSLMPKNAELARLFTSKTVKTIPRQITIPAFS
jgi:hypothetical protein